MRSSKAPQVNAGSMADIAFLLLIFFLVTATILNDSGFNRTLAPDCISQDCGDPISEHNLLRIALNANQEILIEDDIVLLKDIKDIVKTFTDNNGDKSCTYCNGLSLNLYSDNPNKAIISLEVSPQTRYSLFIKVQNELEKAYYELRVAYAQNVLEKEIEHLSDEDLKVVKKAYPFKISEVETK